MANPVWRPTVPVLSNRSLELQRGNGVRYTYTLPGIQTFPTGTTASLALYNASGQSLGIWAGTISGNKITITQSAAVANLVPLGSSWTLSALYPGDSDVTMLCQGTVIRNEAPFPSLPPTTQTQTVNYSYGFATAGTLSDPAFNILSGVPIVYDNSSLNLPNAVAAGSPQAVFQNGDITEVQNDAPYEQASFLYYAPLGTDNCNLTYQVVNGVGVLGGQAYVVITSAYDMSSGVAFVHNQFNSSGQATVGIAVMTGPTTFTVKEQVNYTTNTLDTFTAVYNAPSNTYALYVNTNPTPLVTWQDETNAVPKGPGFRYVGFSFESALIGPGAEVANWYISDTVPGPPIGDVPLVWAATTVAPIATVKALDEFLLTFPQPTSANAPFTYTITAKDVATGVVTTPTVLSGPTVQNNVVSATLSSFADGHSYTFSVVCNTQYPGVSATSLASNQVTAAFLG